YAPAGAILISWTYRAKRLMGEEGVTSVLGTLLMMALMMTLIPDVLLLRQAWDDEMEAQRDAAERAAYCARNPDVGPPTCTPRAPLNGYDCREIQAGAWLCTPQNATNVTAPTVPTGL